MACTTCGTGAKAGSNSELWVGSLLGGASMEMVFARKEVPVKALRAPNIIILDANPYLPIGSKIILDNLSSLDGAFTGVVKCATTTADPVLVGGSWEVATDLVMASLTGSPTLQITTATSSNDYGFGCAPAAGQAKESLTAIFCAGTLNAANFAGQIYTRRPNENSKGVDAYVNPGSNVITVSRRAGLRRGDLVSLSGTNITGASAARVIAIVEGTRKLDGQPITQATLSAPVSITTASLDSDNRYCVSATITPQIAANIQFAVACGCSLTASVPASVTSDPSFPVGNSYDATDCEQQQYYYVIHDFTPGATVPDRCGWLIL